MRSIPPRRILRFAVIALLMVVVAIFAALARMGTPVGELMAQAEAAFLSRRTSGA